MLQVANIPGGGSVSDGGTSCEPVGCQIANGTSKSFTVVAVGGIRLTAGPQATLTLAQGSSDDSGSPSEAPAPSFEISYTPTDGTTCSNSGESGIDGGWLTLPGANDCTPPAAKTGATLLGWATTPDFPVAIAQRQVSNGWGAYESYNDDGQITAVFIPAGLATFLSGSNTLYAIWNQQQ